MNKRKSSKNIILFDIGTASVGGSLVRISKSVPEILYTVRKPIKFKEGILSERITFSMLNTLKEVSENISKEIASKSGSVDEIHCVLSSLWHSSSTKTIKVLKKNPFVLKNSFFDNLINSEEKKFLNNNEIDLIESEIIQTKINGIETDKVKGKEANTLETSIFLSGIFRDLAEKIEETISNSFNKEKIRYSTFSYSIFTILNEIFHRDFIFIDISGELTEVVFVKDNILKKIMTFPIGKNSILREISKKINLSLEETCSKVILTYSKSITENIKNTIKNEIKEHKEKWQNKFKESLQEAEFPNKIFFVSDEDFKSIFEDFIGETFVDRIGKKISEISTIDFAGEDFLNKYVEYSDEAKPDVFISLLSIFSNNK